MKKTVYLFYFIFLLFITGCPWVADDPLVGDWGAKTAGSILIDGEEYQNNTGKDLIVIYFTNEGDFAVSWILNIQNSYYKCYAYNGNLEYWGEMEYYYYTDYYYKKKETTYNVNGDTLEIVWNGKKVILDRL